ncbi:MAG: phosphorylase family protein [Promethearchaeota archaeon]|jgi:uridine phosphorylase
MLNKIKSELLNLGLKFISVDEKIVRMILETSPSNVNEIVILPAINFVMQKIVSKLKNKRVYGRVYNGELNNVKVSVIRSLVGAPNCAIALECLKRCKTKIIIRLDVCGGIENVGSKIKIGDILIPQIVYCDDGTSPQYIREHPSLVNGLESISNPLSKFQNLLTGNQTIYISQPHKELKNLLLEEGNSLFSNIVKQVKLWSTDGLFCESLDFIRALQSINIQAIDMESSILFLLGKLFNLKTASILSVTDLPGDLKYDLLTSKVIHPDMESGIDNTIKLLIYSLPKVNVLLNF